ncbi:PLC-like phosphodiesterase [Basidiobolus meristosporus CBS 931.73]|uniref:PLC-like phosphodiesterase n=1 Tax=Basidiobolus meristosporus CBS 931.73 TaxID=1314790 RepID=A0A1Y1YL97_9FUNG|nr:PLC-like phosphodiesterase [Basidiobolus meristosporus CBS 931.73]|eukprot:ORX98801.1 PLC-like phosphodiesterase [Basidiobolus meristosporus CBS 931.73]
MLRLEPSILTYIATPIITYCGLSYFFFRKPEILHGKKKAPKFKYRVLSHRGGAGDRVENTLPAFRYSTEIDADMLELDVHMTKDGEMVVFHDFTVDRNTEATGPIKDFNYNELPKLVPIPEHRDQPFLADPDSTRIPKLEEVFEAFPDAAIHLEVKPTNPELAEKVYALIKKYNRQEKTLWGCGKGLDMLYDLDPTISKFCSAKTVMKIILSYYTGLLPFITIRENFYNIPTSVTTKWFTLNLLMPKLFEHLHRRGMNVLVFAPVVGAVNTAEGFKACLDAGVDGMFTDKPVFLRQYLKENSS